MTHRRGSRTLEGDDPWILLAILLGNGKPMDLRSIISAADYINHGIPTREQIQGALTRLLAARLIRTRKAGIVPTKLALELHEKARENSRRAILSQLHALDAILACPSCGVRFGKPRRTIDVGPREYDDAVERYRRDF